MNGWEFFIFVVLFEVSFVFMLISWSDEIHQIYRMRKVYYLISIAAIKWSFYLGSRSYSVWWYETSDTEIGDPQTIEFPAIWM